jgi:hypothetical protein
MNTLITKKKAAASQRRTHAYPTSSVSADEAELYRLARAKARRTLTFRLRRQERRIVARARITRPSRVELIRLGAVRSELQVRSTGPGASGRSMP